MFRKYIIPTLFLLIFLECSFALANVRKMTIDEKVMHDQLTAIFLDFIVALHNSVSAPEDFAPLLLAGKPSQEINYYREKLKKWEKLPELRREGNTLIFTEKQGSVQEIEFLNLTEGKIRINGQTLVIDRSVPLGLWDEIYEKKHLKSLPSNESSLWKLFIPSANANLLTRKFKKIPLKTKKTETQLRKEAEDDLKDLREREINNSSAKHWSDKINTRIPFPVHLHGFGAITAVFVGNVMDPGFKSLRADLCSLRSEEAKKNFDPNGFCEPYFTKDAKRADLQCQKDKNSPERYSTQNPDKTWTRWVGQFKGADVDIKEMIMDPKKETVKKVEAEYYMKADPQTGKPILTEIYFPEKKTSLKFKDLKTDQEKLEWAKHVLLIDTLRLSMSECKSSLYNEKVKSAYEDVIQNSNVRRRPPTNNFNSVK